MSTATKLCENIVHGFDHVILRGEGEVFDAVIDEKIEIEISVLQVDFSAVFG